MIDGFVYIAGCPFSGSTLLDLSLGRHPRVCALGETAPVLDEVITKKEFVEISSGKCSCGEKVEQCNIWSEVFKKLIGDQNIGFRGRYTHVLKMVEKSMGTETIVSDSSKYISHLKKRVNLFGKMDNIKIPNDFFVIHIIKDPRSYAVSWKKRRGDSFFRTTRRMYKWKKRNEKIKEFVSKKDINYITISYENFCFDTKGELDKIHNFLSLSNEKLSNINESNSHAIAGNPMRRDSNKKEKVIYDSRWFYDNSVSLAYLCLRGVQNYNKEMSSKQ